MENLKTEYSHKTGVWRDDAPYSRFSEDKTYWLRLGLLLLNPITGASVINAVSVWTRIKKDGH